jgi:hypothetical protein
VRWGFRNCSSAACTTRRRTGTALLWMSTPERAGVLYNYACLLSLAGRGDEAIERLAASIELAPKNVEYARDDPDFDPIRTDPRFAALVPPRRG